MKTPSTRPLISGLTLALLTVGAQASGYRFGTQSAAAEGVANANGAEAADASTIFANPAGLTRLSGMRFSAVLDYVEPKVRFTDAGSIISLPGSGLQPRATSQAGDVQSPAGPAYVPHFYASYQLSDRMVAGFGTFVPWGAKLNYDENWGGRYNIQKVVLKSLAFNPNLAYKATDTLSVAAGLVAQYMEGEIKRAVPYASAYTAGLLAAAGQAAAGGAPALALQLQQQAALIFGDRQYDGRVEVDGKDWGIGFNLALLWEPSADTRLGLNYRSAVKQKLKGDGNWTQPANLPAAVLAAITAAPYDGLGKLDHNDSDASVSVRTPESFSLQGFHQLTPTVALMADATWTRQSRLEQLRIDFSSSTPDSISPEHWEDTLRLALGASWKPTKDLTLRLGVARDRSPVPSSTRSPVLPDAHRTWSTLGANFVVGANTTLDFALGAIDVKDAAMNITDDAEGEKPCNCSNATARGNYTSKASFFGLQINHKF